MGVRRLPKLASAEILSPPFDMNRMNQRFRRMTVTADPTRVTL